MFNTDGLHPVDLAKISKQRDESSRTSLTTPVYVRGSVHKKEREKSLKKGQFTPFSSSKKDIKWKILRQPGIRIQKLTKFRRTLPFYVTQQLGFLMMNQSCWSNQAVCNHILIIWTKEHTFLGEWNNAETILQRWDCSTSWESLHIDLTRTGSSPQGPRIPF